MPRIIFIMSVLNNKREASLPLCEGKVAKFSKVNDLPEVEKIITKRLVNNKIEKVKRVGLVTLKDFCELHDMDTTGTTVSDIIKSMVKEG